MEITIRPLGVIKLAELAGIEWKFDAQGGFFAANRSDNTIAYAYPSSIDALQAIKHPALVANEMLMDSIPMPEYDAHKWEEFNGLVS